MGAKALQISTRDVADLLNVSERHARRVVEAEVTTAAEGGRHREYDLSSLPPEAQAEWARRTNIVPITPANADGQMALSLTVPAGANLSEEDRIEVDRRYRVIEPLLRPDAFIRIWDQNERSRVKVIDWLAKQHDTKRRTIYNWLAAWKEGGINALVPRDRRDKGKPRIMTPAALDFLLAAAFPKHGSYGKLTVRDIYRTYFEERDWRAKNTAKKLSTFELSKYARYTTTDGYLTPSAQLPAASYGTFRNWFERIPEIVKVMAREGDEAFHNTQEIISFRDLTSVKPLDYVVMDHRRLDFFCLVPDRASWKLARPWLTAAIDMRTRKWLAWVIVETPSSDSIAAVLKRAFLEHGLPAACYWDNGKDFRCEWLEGGLTRAESRRIDELQPVFRGVLDTLGVRVHHAIVRRARSKLIEPNFGRTADFDRTLPWWCGHNPGARPTERFDKLLAQHERWLEGANVDPAFPTMEEVATLYDNCLNNLNDRELQGEGMNKIVPKGRGWLTPNEAWAKLAPQVVKRTIPEDVIHLCFAKRRELVIRQGEVRTTFGGRAWHYRIASNPARLMAFNGCTVQFAYDPLDLQTAAVYFEGRLIGLVECIELRRMGEDSFVEDEKVRRVARRETKRFIDIVHRNVYVPDHAERHRRRAVISGEMASTADVVRMEVPALLPAAIIETVAAIEEDRAVKPVIEVEKVATSSALVDDEFNFFG